MNIHQHVLPTITTILPNVFVLRTQTMNPSIGHITIFVNYQPTQSQHVTPIVLSNTGMFTYLNIPNVV
jgi:hypothetical protein